MTADDLKEGLLVQPILTPTVGRVVSWREEPQLGVIDGGTEVIVTIDPVEEEGKEIVGNTMEFGVSGLVIVNEEDDD